MASTHGKRRRLVAGLLVSMSAVSTGCGRNESSWRMGPGQPVAIAPAASIFPATTTPAAMPTVTAEPLATTGLTSSTLAPISESPLAKGPLAIRPVYEATPSAAAAKPQASSDATVTLASPQVKTVVPAAAAVASMVPTASQSSLMLPTQSAASRLPASDVDVATNHLRQGFDLGQRGAFFSARTEFIQTLRTVAQSYDAASVTKIHTQALDAGLVTLDEMEELTPKPRKTSNSLDVPMIVRNHQTSRAARIEPRELSGPELRRQYVDYAAGQFALAVGNEPVAAEALYGLAKVYATLSSQDSRLNVAADSKSMACYRATLLANPSHAVAANDLAVLLAQSGRYHEARELLSVSLTTQQHPAVLHNLAIVSQHLGDSQTAETAERSVQLAAGTSTPPSEQSLNLFQQMVVTDPASFAATSKPTELVASASVAPGSTAAGTVRPATAAASQPAGKSEGLWSKTRAAAQSVAKSIVPPRSDDIPPPSAVIRTAERPTSHRWQQ